MTQLLDKSAEILLLHLWQVTAVIGAVALLNGTLLKKRRHLSYMLWILVLLKCVTPPFWSSSVGLFSWAGHESMVVTADVSGQYAFTPMGPAERTLRLPGRQREAAGERSTAVDVQSAVAVGKQIQPDQRLRHVWPQISWMQLLAGTWLTGCGLFMVWFVRRQIACHLAVRRFSERCEDPVIVARFEELAKEIGLRRHVELFMTTLNIMPATFGVLKSRVILPESLVATESQCNIDLMLTHELTHVRRWDTLHALLQTLAQGLWWFHPLVWWANRQIVQQRERCCDEELVATLRCDSGEYAECLVNVLRERRAVRALPGAVGIGPLELTRQRLEMIMSFDDRLNVRTPRSC